MTERERGGEGEKKKGVEKGAETIVSQLLVSTKEWIKSNLGTT